MPPAKSLNPFDNPFGYALRRHRTRLEFTQEQLGKRLGYSGDAIGKFEKGEVAPSLELGRACDEVFGTHGDMEQLTELVRNGRVFPSWYGPFVEFEREARRLQSWEPLLIPGLLQTPVYARELLKAQPGATAQRVEELLTARLERQAIFDRDNPPSALFIIAEGALHYPVGDSKIMYDQLQHLLEMSYHTHVRIQVVPADAGAHSGMNGAFVIASLDGGVDVVYLDAATKGPILDGSEDVTEIWNIFDAIRAEALPARASLDLITEVMETRWKPQS